MDGLVRWRFAGLVASYPCASGPRRSCPRRLHPRREGRGIRGFLALPGTARMVGGRASCRFGCCWTPSRSLPLGGLRTGPEIEG